jgi:outer membrane autotransporter protein
MRIKILEATCSADGQVSVEGVIVSSAVVLSLGKQESTGLVFMEEGKAWYLTSSAADIESTLESVIDAVSDISDALTKIASILTSIGAGMTGASTAPPPTLGSDVSALNAKISALGDAKTDLQNLKEALK